MTDRLPPDVLGEMDRWLLGEGRHRHPWKVLGAHPAERAGIAGVTFAVWAPGASAVSVVGEWNAWDPTRDRLGTVGPPGYWEGFVAGAARGQRYKFHVTAAAGTVMPLKADPFAFHCEQPLGSASVVHGVPQHPWRDGPWMEQRAARQAPAAPLSFYEVHLGSWRRHPDGRFYTYRELAETLVPYVASLGFTHVELLPVMEHPFYGSWGYQPLGLFAPSSRFGTPEDFQALVEAFHQAGIGVVLDWVPAHFPEDPHGLVRFDGTCLYEHEDPRQGRHPDWSTLIYNFGRLEVENLLIANALYWLEEFHIDGLRVDAVASMLYLDYSRGEGQWIPNQHGGRENLEAIAFLRRLNGAVQREFPGVLTIAEESTAWPGVSRPEAEGGLGFSLKWNMGWMHDTLRYFGHAMPARGEHHDTITFSRLYHDEERFVLPLSHDEVVHGKRSLLGRMPGSPWERWANLRLLLGWQWVHAGKKLLFMGSELGPEQEWAHDGELPWALAAQAESAGLTRWLATLNRLYREHPALHRGDCTPEGFTWLDCHDRARSTLSVLRRGEGAPPVAALVNFGGHPIPGFSVGLPTAGAWRVLACSDALEFGGTGRVPPGTLHAKGPPLHGQPASLVLELPPLAVVVLTSG